MIRGFVVTDRERIARFEKLPASVFQELKKAVWRITLRLQREVKEGKLSGQVLHVRTGTLRRSINADVSETATAVVGTVGTNVKYGRIHELGFSGTVDVKTHLRTIKQAFGRQLKDQKSVSVSAHTRNVVLPQRSFLRTALKGMEPQIRKELEQAVSTAVRAVR